MACYGRTHERFTYTYTDFSCKLMVFMNLQIFFFLCRDAKECFFYFQFLFFLFFCYLVSLTTDHISHACKNKAHFEISIFFSEEIKFLIASATVFRKNILDFSLCLKFFL